ncbi:Uu.00g022570.m01.CDS01 [Anthostomella pinea]|uniref:Uu.00g022570.m01.CDS01 n=1 Tax=Anthostomella pinea TaxID=933095 RepID=A0AAI8VZX2_9PEZI|nr:Uu.00g022570.m01.CDS01 [Anthostomella pinea]
MDDPTHGDNDGFVQEKSVPEPGDKVPTSPSKEKDNETVEAIPEATQTTPEMRLKIISYFGRKAEEDQLVPSADVIYILDKIALMAKEQALEILIEAIEHHSDDPNFPSEIMTKIKLLLQGPDSPGLVSTDYEFDLKTEAATIHYYSPYPEVRSVTTPSDDPDTPFETIRAYLLGLMLMGGCTAVNTFFSPRQPAIGIPALVLQLLVAPCGLFLARILPDWGVTIYGTRHSLNPGPWNYKEQRLPQYFGNTWVTFGYEIVLALSVQFFGLGFAGLLRRFVIYPVTAIFPQVLPALALNRALVLPENKSEVVNRWKLSRYKMFIACAVVMFAWFWVPNYLFQALRSFNWMT